MGIKYVTGDLFDHLPATKPNKVIPHVVNDRGAWGSGFVIPLGRKWPLARERYLEWADQGRDLNGNLFQAGFFQSVRVERNEFDGYGNVYVVNMIGQNGVISPNNLRPLNYAALGAAMNLIGVNAVLIKEDLGLDSEIHCPCFGAGLAGGDWNIIELLIEDAWVRQGIPVTVYQLPGQEVRSIEANDGGTDE